MGGRYVRVWLQHSLVKIWDMQGLVEARGVSPGSFYHRAAHGQVRDMSLVQRGPPRKQNSTCCPLEAVGEAPGGDDGGEGGLLGQASGKAQPPGGPRCWSFGLRLAYVSLLQLCTLGRLVFILGVLSPGLLHSRRILPCLRHLSSLWTHLSSACKELCMTWKGTELIPVHTWGVWGPGLHSGQYVSLYQMCVTWPPQ